MKSWYTLFVFAVLMAACNKDPETTVLVEPAAKETLESLEVQLPPQVLMDQPFEITVVAIGSKGTKPLPSFTGAVQLKVNSGTLSVDTISLKDGVGKGNVTLNGPVGALEVSAASDNIKGVAKLQLKARIVGIAGNPNDLVAGKIPDLDYIARAADFSTDHPQLKGLELSFNTLLVVFALDTTVAQANAALQDVDASIVGGQPGVNGEAAGILAIRLPTKNHAEMIPVLERMRTLPKVETVSQDVILEPTITTPSNGGTPAGWTWESTPTGGNWGLELIGVPQMWNFNASIKKAGGTTEVTVLDVGFADTHEDLVMNTRTSTTVHAHGLHVAGTIGAIFANRKGVDGINPFAKLNLLQATSFGQGIITDFDKISDTVKVVNISLGYNWYRYDPPIDSDTSVRAQTAANADGRIFRQYELGRIARGGKLPVVIVAAGNESGQIAGAGTTDTKYASPFTNAAMVLGVANVIVVEALQNAPGNPGGATRANFSSVNGQISAPGFNILSTTVSYTETVDGQTVQRNDGPYASKAGTSMAAPHVAGVASYLYAMKPDFPRPTITANAMKDLLLQSAVQIGNGVPPRVDAFQAATTLNNGSYLKDLTDIDDGTPDGNQRIAAGTTADFLNEDVDGNGGLGDGQVDLSDFRRWRDALLQIENPSSLTLDGSATHPKKDLNGDGIIGVEGLDPQADFNGDGQVSRTARVPVRGQSLTDLEVLQLNFSDPNLPVGSLPGLINSGDFQLRFERCFQYPRVYSVNVSSQGVQSRFVTASDQTQILTLPVSAAGQTVRLEVKDSNGILFNTLVLTPNVTLGGDTIENPDCAPPSGPDQFDAQAANETFETATVLAKQGGYEANFHNETDVDYYDAKAQPSPFSGTVNLGAYGSLWFRVVLHEVPLRYRVFDFKNRTIADVYCINSADPCGTKLPPGEFWVGVQRIAGFTARGGYTFQIATELENPQLVLPDWLPQYYPIPKLIGLPSYGPPTPFILTGLENHHIFEISKGNTIAVLEGTGLDLTLLDATGKAVAKGIDLKTDGATPKIGVTLPSSLTVKSPYLLQVKRQTPLEDPPKGIPYMLGIQ
jgi:Subtilase family